MTWHKEIRYCLDSNYQYLTYSQRQSLTNASNDFRPGARPILHEWVMELRDQCLRANVPFFFKHWGGVQKKRAGRTLEGRTWAEMPIRMNLVKV
jgi:protein gp37